MSFVPSYFNLQLVFLNVPDSVVFVKMVFSVDIRSHGYDDTNQSKSNDN